MGRVMLTANAHGATHERIGSIGAVVPDGAMLRLTGPAHDALIDGASIGAVIADRTGRMKDKALPRLEFLNASGELIFSLICLEGLEPFDAALAPLGGGASLPEKAKPPPDPASLEEGDPGAAPFIAAAGRAVTISIDVAGFSQRWSGVVDAMKPAMGFINVMTPDFHLHLRGGSVARWRRTDDAADVLLTGENAGGEAIGLHVRGSAAAFADF
jgi:hypothetical protein